MHRAARVGVSIWSFGAKPAWSFGLRLLAGTEGGLGLLCCAHSSIIESKERGLFAF